VSFNASLRFEPDKAVIRLEGELDASATSGLHNKIEQAISANVHWLEFRAHDLTYMSSAGLRSLLFARQKIGDEGRITVIGASEMVIQTIRLTGLDLSIGMSDE
jgi:anti-anti-sigma factor